MRTLDVSIENENYETFGEVKLTKGATTGNQVFAIWGTGYVRAEGDVKFLVDNNWVTRTAVGNITVSPDAGKIIIEDKYNISSINSDYYNTKISVPANKLEYLGTNDFVLTSCGVNGLLTDNLKYIKGVTNLLYLAESYGELSDEDYLNVGSNVKALDMGSFGGDPIFIRKLFDGEQNRLERVVIGRNKYAEGNLSELYNAPVLRYIAADRSSSFKFSWPSASLRNSELPIIRVDYSPMFGSSADVDNYLINMSNCVVSVAGAINIGGPARTSASDSAIATLKSKGYSININNIPQ